MLLWKFRVRLPLLAARDKDPPPPLPDEEDTDVVEEEAEDPVETEPGPEPDDVSGCLRMNRAGSLGGLDDDAPPPRGDLW